MGKIDKTAQEHLKEPYEFVVIRDDEGGAFTAKIAEFHGCIASGETEDEALKNLKEVALEWIEAANEQGHEIPEPFAKQEYSGPEIQPW